jgi:MoxR-like ATPase
MAAVNADPSPAPPAPPTPPPTSATFGELFDAIVSNVERVIQGKRSAVELALICLVAEGHLLIEDVPGVGKTSLAKALATSIDAGWGRIQFTPDLLPSDVLGVSVFNRQTSTFEFRPGPVFNAVVLADEINRASPKTQSALLEAMEERQVTVDGTSHLLDEPFIVLATQNPVDHEGTYPLPESQLDRFVMRISLGYPDRAAEVAILDTHAAHGAADPSGVAAVRPVATERDVRRMIMAARGVHVAPALRHYLVDIADATRRSRHLTLGMSPRATLALQKVARVRAAAAGRAYVEPDDVKAVAGPVLAHRLSLSSEASMHGLTADDVVAEILSAVPVPVERVG